MPTYFVASTEFEKTAEVAAPTPRKARTALLDYLERGEEIDRDQRQLLRETMATKKVRPGSTGADISLDYDMRDERLVHQPEPVQEFEGFEEEVEEPVVAPGRIATELPPSIRPIQVRRPDMYERPPVRTQPVQAAPQFEQRQLAQASVQRVPIEPTRYSPQREIPTMMGSPIAQVARRSTL